MEEIWKDIPLEEFVGYQVSNLGNFKLKDTESQRNLVYGLRIKKSKRSSTGYKAVTMSLKNGIRIDYYLHRLVCLAFNSIPEGLPKNLRYKFVDRVPYVVNHKNGNTLDNDSENLEWTTVIANNNHALDTKLRKDSVWITVIDLKTNTAKDYRSMNQLCAELKIDNSSIYPIIYRSKEKPYLDRYLFEVMVLQSLDNTSSISKTPIIFKDYVTNVVTITRSRNEASLLTGIGRTVISLYADTERMIAGYVFRKLEPEAKAWPQFNHEYMLAVRLLFFNKSDNSSSSQVAVKAFNIATGETLLFHCIEDAARHFNIAKHKLKSILKKERMSEGRVHNGIRYERLDESAKESVNE